MNSSVDHTLDTAAAGLDARGEDVNRLRLVLLRLARKIRTNSIGYVTQSQAAVVATLARHGPSTIGQIAEHEQVRPPSASKIVASLEARGLVNRRPDPDDRRCALIELSADGERFIAQVRAAGTSWLASRLDLLDEAERIALDEALPALEHLLGPTE